MEVQESFLVEGQMLREGIPHGLRHLIKESKAIC